MMTSFPRGIALTAEFLRNNGFDHRLLSYYKRSRWLESLGDGAYKKRGEKVDWRGGLAALQGQLKLPVHCGARTSLELQGYAHYGEATGRSVYLFGPSGQRLPKWFEKHDWGVQVLYKMSRLFPEEVKGTLLDFSVGEFSLRISSPERAAMEMLYHVPSRQGFDEAERIMESLLTLRPALVRRLLEACNSVKVKRLFLYMAEKSGLTWTEEIDVTKINLGKGDRTIIKGGRLDSKYRITVPRN
jgi:hypothetical protein